MVDAREMHEKSECVEPKLHCLSEEDEELNLMEELERSTMMRTRDRYKSLTNTFLLHKYRRNDPTLNLAFA